MIALLIPLLVAVVAFLIVAATRFGRIYFAPRPKLEVVDYDFTPPKRDLIDTAAVVQNLKTDPEHEAKVIRLRERMLDGKKKR